MHSHPSQSARRMGHPEFHLPWIVAIGLALCAGPLVAQRPSYHPSNPAQQFAVAGTVVNAVSGDPVRGASVTLAAQQDDSVPQATARTDDEGRFALTPVGPGKYQLAAARRGYSTSLYEQHGNFSSAVVTGPGQDTGHIVFRLPPQAVLRGVVTADGGDPVEGAEVFLFSKPAVEAPGERTYLREHTIADDTGAYEFADLPPGDYLVAVIARPWYALHPVPGQSRADTELDVAYPVTYYDSTADEASALPLRLTPGSRIDANLSLHAVPALHFAVPGAGNVIAALEQSIFGLKEFGVSSNVTRNDDGEVEFYGVAPGHYQLSAGTPAKVLEIDATGNNPVDLSTGTSAVTIAGEVDTAPGVLFTQPAVVELKLADPAEVQPPLVTAVQQGKFSFDTVAAGHWLLTMEDGYGYSMQVGSIETNGRKQAGGQLTVRGQAMQVVVTATQGAHTIEGFALREGKGAAGVMVVLAPHDLKNYPALARRDQADSDGSFSLANVLAGDYTVVAVSDAWEMDWARPETIVRYLPGGTTVTVSGAAGVISLKQAVNVQPRY